MTIAELRFAHPADADGEAVMEAFDLLLSALRMNGQVCGRELLVYGGDDWVAAHVLLAAPDAFDPAHRNHYVRRALAPGGEPPLLGPPELRILGDSLLSADPCACARPASLILFTDDRSLAPPVRCGDCFYPVPLYRLPPTYDGEYYDIISWMSDFQHCDGLQMGCKVLERAALRQLGDAASPLSRQGREICARLAGLAGVPVYYRLLRWNGRSMAAERRRPCPGCGGAWLLAEPWHGFDFRCDACRLVSNIAYSVNRS